MVDPGLEAGKHVLCEKPLAGAVGELRAIRSSFSFSLDDRAEVRLQAGLDGGALRDLGCSCLSGARLVAGSEPELVIGEQVTGGDGVDVAFAAAAAGTRAPRLGREDALGQARAIEALYESASNRRAVWL